MTVTMPNIDVTFKGLASSLVARSERGYAILIVRDDTDKTFEYKEYNLLTDVDKTKYTAANYQCISDVFAFAPYKVCVVRIDATSTGTLPTVADALKIVLANVATGWITVAGGTSADFTTLASWIKSQAASKKTYKAVVYNATTSPDEMHVVNFVNTYVTFSDSRGKVTGLSYCPSLIGILAKSNVVSGCNYFKCTNLSRTIEVDDNNAALAAGKFILINDGAYVRIARSINSLITTNGTTVTEDMKEIEVVEAMDLMLDDISRTFRNDYLGGGYKNKYDNQVLFISAVNSYFKKLANNDVLDLGYNNVCDIDVNAQRNAWIASGKTDAASWTDLQVKHNAYKRSLFLTANAKVLQSMVDLSFGINLN
jgi:hypothetical protein